MDRPRVVIEYAQDDSSEAMLVRRMLVNGEAVTFLDDTSIDFIGATLVRVNLSFLPSSVEFVKVDKEP